MQVGWYMGSKLLYWHLRSPTSGFYTCLDLQHLHLDAPPTYVQSKSLTLIFHTACCILFDCQQLCWMDFSKQAAAQAKKPQKAQTHRRHVDRKPQVTDQESEISTQVLANQMASIDINLHTMLSKSKNTVCYWFIHVLRFFQIYHSQISWLSQISLLHDRLAEYLIHSNSITEPSIDFDSFFDWALGWQRCVRLHWNWNCAAMCCWLQTSCWNWLTVWICPCLPNQPKKSICIKYNS